MATTSGKSTARPTPVAAGINPAMGGGAGRRVGQAPGMGGTGPSVTSGLQSFLSSIGSGLQEQINTGFNSDFKALEDSLRGASDKRFDLRSADIRERLGGLGLRFGTDVANQTAQAGVDTNNELNSILGPLSFQSQEGSANRKVGGVGTGLQLPSMFQGLFDAGEAARLAPLTGAETFATGFAPTGSKTSSKGGGLSVMGG